MVSQHSSTGITGVALVTGVGSGIGRATYLLFALEGARGLAIADISQGNAYRVKQEVENVASNPAFSCIFVKTDVPDEQSVNEMVAAVVKTFGRLDYAAKCAGIGHKKEFNKSKISEWNRVRYWQPEQFYAWLMPDYGWRLPRALIVTQTMKRKKISDPINHL